MITVTTLALAAAGCSLSAPPAAQTPLAHTWPTSEPDATLPSPTPFPRLGLEPAATPTPTAARPTPGATSRPASAGLTPTSPAGTQNPPAAQAQILSPGLNVRGGPSVEYPVVAVLAQGDKVPILGIQPDGDWLRVQLPGGGTGWISGAPAYVRMIGQPPVSPPPIASASEIRGDGDDSTAGTYLAPALEIVAPEVPISGQPGGAAVGALKQGEVVPVVGFHAETSSVLVALPGGGAGWMPLAAGQVRLASGLASQAPGHSPAGRPAPAGGLSGRLIVQSASGGEIYLVNADGTGLRRLTGGIDPVLSPDGSRLAFTRWGPGEVGSLWVLDLASGEERQVLGETRQAKHPAWAPDGRRIVLNFQHEGRQEAKPVCTNLVKSQGELPAIPLNVDPHTVHVNSRDDIPYLCWRLPPDPHWGLRMANLDDGSFEDVPSDSYAYGPEWDPANPWRIVSSGLHGMVQLDVNRLVQWPLTDRYEDHTPVFSPDGRYIAVAYRGGGRWAIHRLNADGSGRVALTRVPMSALVEGRQPWNDTAPAWSPDGSKIAFLSDRTGRWELWVMNADGGDQSPLLPEEVQAQLQLLYNAVDERMISWAR